MASNAQVFRESIQMLSEQSGLSVSEVLAASADMHENASDRVHADMDGLSYEQMKAVFFQTGLSDQEVRGVSQAVIDTAYNVYDGDMSQSLARIEEENDPRIAVIKDEDRNLQAPAAVESGPVEPEEATAEEGSPELTEDSDVTTTEAVIGRDAFAQIHSTFAEVEADPTLEADNAQRRAGLEEMISSDSTPPAIAATFQAVLDYADEHHGGSLNYAMSAIGDMEPDQAYEALNLNNLTETDTTLPASPSSEVEPDQSAPTGAEGSESVLEGVQSGLTVGEISAALQDVNTSMISRGMIEGFAENGVPEGIANAMQMSPDEAQQLMQTALTITDQHFDGNFDQAIAFLKTEGGNEQYSNLTVDQLSAALSQSPETEVVSEQRAADLRREENHAQLNRLAGLFNDESFTGALQNGDFGQIIQMIVSAITGQSVSMSNDATAFAGVQTPDGSVVPTGSQIDPATGQPVETPAADNDDRAPTVTDPQLATAGMRV